MPGIFEPPDKANVQGLIVRGYSPQYVASYTRDATLPAVNISANIRLPLYAAEIEREIVVHSKKYGRNWRTRG